MLKVVILSLVPEGSLRSQMLQTGGEGGGRGAGGQRGEVEANKKTGNEQHRAVSDVVAR